MRGSSWAVVGLVVTLLASEAHATKLFAVLPLDVSHAKGRLDVDAEASLEDMLRDVAANKLAPAGWIVLTSDNTLQVLQDNGIDPARCGDESCHLTAAREIKADKFISGAVQYVDGRFTASIRLIDMTTGRIIASALLESPDATGLRHEFEGKADALFATLTSIARLIISAHPADSVRLELVDPHGVKVTSGATYENDAAIPGTWTISVAAVGYGSESQTVHVTAGRTTRIQFDLKQQEARSSGTTSAPASTSAGAATPPVTAESPAGQPAAPPKPTHPPKPDLTMQIGLYGRFGGAAWHAADVTPPVATATLGLRALGVPVHNGLAFELDTELGYTSGFYYELNVLLGYGRWFSHVFGLALMGGLGLSGSYSSVPFGLEGPVELDLLFNVSPKVQLTAFFRPQWFLYTSTSRYGGSASLPFVDELRTGVTCNFGTHKGTGATGFYVGASESELMKSRMISVYVGFGAADENP